MFQDYETDFLDSLRQCKAQLANKHFKDKQSINENISNMKFSLNSMEQESISSKNYIQRVKEYSRQFKEVQQEVKERDLSLEREALFGQQFGAYSMSKDRQRGWNDGIDDDMYQNQLRSNANLLQAKQGLYQIEANLNNAMGHVERQNRQIDNMIERNKDMRSDVGQSEQQIKEMQRRINCNRCLRYALYAFIVLGFVFIIVYKVFL